jgi:DNA-binding response OmpR family regulator
VEDEVLVGMLVVDILSDLGCECIGPIAKVEAALDLAQTETFDAAILDLRIAGREVYSVAEVLAGREIPFAIATGFPSDGIDGKWRDRPYLAKPFVVDEIKRWLTSFSSPHGMASAAAPSL